MCERHEPFTFGREMWVFAPKPATQFGEVGGAPLRVPIAVHACDDRIVVTLIARIRLEPERYDEIQVLRRRWKPVIRRHDTDHRVRRASQPDRAAQHTWVTTKSRAP